MSKSPEFQDNGSVGQQLAVRQDHYCFGCGRQNPHGLKLTFFANDAGEVWTDWHKTEEEMTHYGSGPRHSHGYKPLKV